MPVSLDDLAVHARQAAEAKAAERSELDVRDAAIVAAVRAGARLDEIGAAAGITKAGASAIARQALEPRPARGGPYRRRRGAEEALRRVQETAERALEARRRTRDVIRERDQAIVAAIDGGIGAPAIAGAVGMNAKGLNTLVRRRRSEAMSAPVGTVASRIAEGKKRTA